MTKGIHKHLACALIFIIKVLCCSFLFCANELKAQDTVSFNAVEIKVLKIDLSETGKKTERIDSSTKAQFKLNGLQDLLTNNSTIFIKNYGPGAIASTAMRGGNASQTAILWNGFNIQNTMLGQTDLSLLPVFLFDDVKLEYGGSSSVWGSGAIAGNIQLSSQSKFGAGNFSSVSVGAGSFGKLSSTAHVRFSKEKFISSSKIYFSQSQNDFKYKDTSDHIDPIKCAKDASFESKGFMQDFKFLLKKDQQIALSAWIHDSKRKLQAFDPQNESKAAQGDNTLRFTAAWNYGGKKTHSVLRSCFFQDKIKYEDGVSDQISNSTSRSFMIENETYFKWLKNQQANLSVNALSSTATTDNYESRKSMERITFLAGNRSFWFRNKLTTAASLRFDYFNVSHLPLTGNLSAEYKLIKTIFLKANAAKVYRQPTLNELYWQPGGNPELKPEQGYTFEGEINYQQKVKAFTFYISLAAFNRKIQDWILWTPGANAQPAPSNVQDVWSRGTETTWKINYEYRHLRAGLSLMSSYVLATVLSSQKENDMAVGKQLIYTPRYVFNGTAYLGYKQIQIYYFHQYTGYRFTSTDNSSWLTPYDLGSVRANYGIDLSKLKVLLFAACNNLFDENYSVINQRPMPLRNYEIGITVQFKH